MTTLADLETQVSRDLRDTTNAVFSVAEVDDLINQGISALASFYPKQVVQTIGTVSAGVYSYSASAFTRIYRIDIYSSAGSYKSTLDGYIGGSPNTGWEQHGQVVYLPPLVTFTAGDTLRAFGYGGYIQIAASSNSTDLDTDAIWAVRVFAQVEAFERLLADRATFQQWQASPGNTDVTAMALASLARSARARWLGEQQRLRRLRKVG